jgi:hypothetical protein
MNDSGCGCASCAFRRSVIVVYMSMLNWLAVALADEDGPGKLPPGAPPTCTSHLGSFLYVFHRALQINSKARGSPRNSCSPPQSASHRSWCSHTVARDGRSSLRLARNSRVRGNYPSCSTSTDSPECQASRLMRLTRVKHSLDGSCQQYGHQSLRFYRLLGWMQRW